MASVIGTNGEKEYKILKFSAYYENTKFTEFRFPTTGPTTTNSTATTTFLR